MSPKLRDGDYIFAVVGTEEIAKLDPLLTFEEEEGTTVIIKKEEADANKIPYETVWKLITLQIHSALMAVGLLAAVSQKLAQAGISVNVVSAFYHDHLFILPERVDEAMRILEEFSKK